MLVVFYLINNIFMKISRKYEQVFRHYPELVVKVFPLSGFFAYEVHIMHTRLLKETNPALPNMTDGTGSMSFFTVYYSFQ